MLHSSTHCRIVICLSSITCYKDSRSQGIWVTKCGAWCLNWSRDIKWSCQSNELLKRTCVKNRVKIELITSHHGASHCGPAIELCQRLGQCKRKDQEQNSLTETSSEQSSKQVPQDSTFHCMICAFSIGNCLHSRLSFNPSGPVLEVLMRYQMPKERRRNWIALWICSLVLRISIRSLPKSWKLLAQSRRSLFDLSNEPLSLQRATTQLLSRIWWSLLLIGLEPKMVIRQRWIAHSRSELLRNHLDGLHH